MVNFICEEQGRSHYFLLMGKCVLMSYIACDASRCFLLLLCMDICVRMGRVEKGTILVLYSRHAQLVFIL